ncbi:MAG: hypothetical protein Kow0062_28690 [Acidobacteriota bacterium]
MRSTSERVLRGLLAAVLLAAASAAPPVRAAEDGGPLLWRIERPGRPPAWLFGTVHLPVAVVGTPPRAVRAALDESAVVLTEIPLDGASQADLLMRAVQPPGRSLADDLPPELWSRVETTLAARGLPAAAFARFRPWALLGQLATLEWIDEAARSPALDQWIWNRATAAGREVAGLETVAEQVAAFEGFDTAEQAELVRLALDQLEAPADGPSPGRRLVAAYRAGRLDALLALFEAEVDLATPLGRKFRDRLLDRRNARMDSRIAAWLERSERGIFVAVGAMHLAGDGGLIARLGRRGYRVVREAATAAAAPAPAGR